MTAVALTPHEMKRITLIAQPYDSAVRDFRMGAGVDVLIGQCEVPRMLRDHGLDVAVVTIELETEPGYEIRRTFTLLAALADAVRAAVAEKRFPIVVAGNCNTAVATTAGLRRSELGVVWFDAQPTSIFRRTTGPASSMSSRFRS